MFVYLIMFVNLMPCNFHNGLSLIAQASLKTTPRDVWVLSQTSHNLEARLVICID